MKKQLTVQEIQAKMEDLCARSEQCSFDIRRKLFAKGLRGEEADRIIDSLIERRFIDDSRFAHAFVREKYRLSAWGRNKIRAWFAARRFSRDVIDEAMEEIDMKVYISRAFSVMKTKARSLPQDESERRTVRDKIIRYALARGYETSLVIKIIESGKLWETS